MGLPAPGPDRYSCLHSVSASVLPNLTRFERDPLRMAHRECFALHARGALLASFDRHKNLSRRIAHIPRRIDKERPGQSPWLRALQHPFIDVKVLCDRVDRTIFDRVQLNHQMSQNSEDRSVGAPEPYEDVDVGSNSRECL